MSRGKRRFHEVSCHRPIYKHIYKVPALSQYVSTLVRFRFPFFRSFFSFLQFVITTENIYIVVRDCGCKPYNNRFFPSTYKMFGCGDCDYMCFPRGKCVSYCMRAVEKMTDGLRKFVVLGKCTLKPARTIRLELMSCIVQDINVLSKIDVIYASRNMI